MKVKDNVEKTKGFVGEFWKFIQKGNVVDLTVGFVVGTGFNDIIQSFVDNIIMPPIGQLLGNSSFSQLYINLSDQRFDTLAQAEEAGTAVVKYGLFITELIDFLILALVVFIVLKFVLGQKFSEERK